MGREKRGNRRARRKDFDWAELPDDELLEVRMCELGLRIEKTPLAKRVERLYAELEHREIRFRPHCWLSDEWFSCDGVPGIAIPFYLAHPRLARLERKLMLEVEGGTQDWCMRILRHEAGHAIDTAYGLHRRRRWREVFGKYSQPYPSFYQPKPYSKKYVLHLDSWYAQSHPSEDFAETFAVWLKPRSRWRSQYRGWSALKKLQYVDELMTEIRDARPAVVTRRHVAPLRSMRKTLGSTTRRSVPGTAWTTRSSTTAICGGCFASRRTVRSFPARRPFCVAFAPSCAGSWRAGRVNTSTRSTRCWGR